jgi:hypothetical protein
MMVSDGQPYETPSDAQNALSAEADQGSTHIPMDGQPSGQKDKKITADLVHRDSKSGTFMIE